MTKKKEPRGNKHKRRTKDKLRVRGSLYVAIPFLALVFLIGGGWLFIRNRKASPVTPAEIEAEIIPSEGEQTPYGIALSIENTPMFIEYHHTASLTSQQEAIIRDALLPLKAPCCDDNSMATCCCPCNLAKSVWGLSSSLIVEKDYDAAQVREAALQWLRFIFSDYYVIQELRNRDVDPGTYGLSYEDSCYAGLCELPFVEGGCGGMERLRL